MWPDSRTSVTIISTIMTRWNLTNVTRLNCSAGRGARLFSWILRGEPTSRTNSHCRAQRSLPRPPRPRSPPRRKPVGHPLVHPSSASQPPEHQPPRYRLCSPPRTGTWCSRKRPQPTPVSGSHTGTVELCAPEFRCLVDTWPPMQHSQLSWCWKRGTLSMLWQRLSRATEELTRTSPDVRSSSRAQPVRGCTLTTHTPRTPLRKRWRRFGFFPRVESLCSSEQTVIETQPSGPIWRPLPRGEQMLWW